MQSRLDRQGRGTNSAQLSTFPAPRAAVLAALQAHPLFLQVHIWDQGSGLPRPYHIGHRRGHG
jgi:hypothetical protein